MYAFSQEMLQWIEIAMLHGASLIVTPESSDQLSYVKSGVSTVHIKTSVGTLKEAYSLENLYVDPAGS